MVESEKEFWTRQPKETAKAYAAFCIYRDLGPRERSLIETGRRYYKAKNRLNLAQVKKWSSKYSWVERCKAYDDFQDEQKRQADLEALLEMSVRQAQIGKDMQDLGNKGLQERLQAQRIGEMNTLDIVRLTRTGAEIERLARGVPTEIVEEQKKERDVLVIEFGAEEEEER